MGIVYYEIYCIGQFEDDLHPILCLERYKISMSCVLSLTKCESNFLIYDETQHISRDELALINSILCTKNLEIKGGDLKAVEANTHLFRSSKELQIYYWLTDASNVYYWI